MSVQVGDKIYTDPQQIFDWLQQMDPAITQECYYDYKKNEWDLLGLEDDARIQFEEELEKEQKEQDEKMKKQLMTKDQEMKVRGFKEKDKKEKEKSEKEKRAREKIQKDKKEKERKEKGKKEKDKKEKDKEKSTKENRRKLTEKRGATGRSHKGSPKKKQKMTSAPCITELMAPPSSTTSSLQMDAKGGVANTNEVKTEHVKDNSEQSGDKLGFKRHLDSKDVPNKPCVGIKQESIENTSIVKLHLKPLDCADAQPVSDPQSSNLQPASTDSSQPHSRIKKEQLEDKPKIFAKDAKTREIYLKCIQETNIDELKDLQQEYCTLRATTKTKFTRNGVRQIPCSSKGPSTLSGYPKLKSLYSEALGNGELLLCAQYLKLLKLLLTRGSHGDLNPWEPCFKNGEYNRVDIRDGVACIDLTQTDDEPPSFNSKNVAPARKKKQLKLEPGAEEHQ